MQQKEKYEIVKEKINTIKLNFDQKYKEKKEQNIQHINELRQEVKEDKIAYYVKYNEKLNKIKAYKDKKIEKENSIYQKKIDKLNNKNLDHDDAKYIKKFNNINNYNNKSIEAINNNYDKMLSNLKEAKSIKLEEFRWIVSDYIKTSNSVLKRQKTEKYNKINLAKSKNKFKFDYECQKQKLNEKLNDSNDKNEISTIRIQLKNLSTDLYEKNSYLYKPFKIKTRDRFENQLQKISSSCNDTKTKIKLLKHKTLKDWLNISIFGCPLYLYLIILAIAIIAIATNTVKAEIVAGIGILFAISMIIGTVFNKIPIWKTYFGGGAVACFIIAGLLGKTFNVIPKESLADIISFFSGKNGGGLLNLYITVLLCGAILTLPKKLIISSFGKYGGLLLATMIISGGLGLGFSKAIGLETDVAILEVLGPIFGDGNGGGAIPMADIAGQSGYAPDPDVYYSRIIVIVILANIFMIIASSITGKKLGLSKFSGEGKLLKKSVFLREEKNTAKVRHTTIALVLFCAILIISTTIEHIIKENTKTDIFKNGIIISNFAWAILISVILNLCGLVPKSIQQGGQKVNNYFVKEFTLVIMAGIGLTVDFKEFANSFDYRLIFATLATCLFTLLSAFFLSRLFGMFAFEAMIAAGACLGAMGGSGAVACMTSCDRMGLMPYAQISCRVAGSLVLIIVSPLFSVFAAT